MPSWKEILEQFAMVKAGPTPSVIVIFAGFVIIWGAVNWSYSAILSSKSSQIELLDRQISDYKDKLNGASPSDAKARIDALEARVSRVEPRRLSREQKKKITENVKVISSGISYSLSIESEMSCQDCFQYATDFQEVLSGAHWTIEVPIVSPSTASSKGIAILTPDLNDPLPEALALMGALTEAKIPFDMKAGWAGVRQSGVDAPIVALLITARGPF